ncbi:hypothetical protein [Dysgonomonas sp. Marseille-Q5470]|uniref:hypothetical protein n=1 Tax=Dysgonomonas sp. Marseille-Q5470 TaxID=3039494 RepID=UPI0024BD1FBE|nr:hypothetical protein [Dysgonomonas sp. Marseille-Q5470]
MRKGYIKLPVLEIMPDSRTELRSLSDEEWIRYVLYFLLKYYQEVDHTEIRSLINLEKSKKRAEIEYAIKKHIRNWLKRRCKEFDIHEFIINLEPSTEGNIEGFYDLKFEHSQWRNKYFSFEAKNIGKSNSITLSKSIEEYIYVKNKDDGGVYRFMNQKYAPYLNFGGMLGFVIDKSDTSSIVNLLIDNIESIYNDSFIGSLSGTKIVRNSIFNSANTFSSFHTIKDCKTNNPKDFRLYHIIMNFAEVD